MTVATSADVGMLERQERRFALCLFAPAFLLLLVTTTAPLFADVVIEKGIARGQTVAYRGHQILPGGDGPKTTRIGTGLDGRRFLDMFKTTMARYGRPAA